MIRYGCSLTITVIGHVKAPLTTEFFNPASYPLVFPNDVRLTGFWTLQTIDHQ